MFKQTRASRPTAGCGRKIAAANPGGRPSVAVRIVTYGVLISVAVSAAALVTLCLCAYLTMMRMPAKSYAGPLPPLTGEQLALRDELVRDVDKLATQIGERNIWNYANLAAAANFLEASLAEVGYKPRLQNFTAAGKTCCNIEVEIKGSTHPEQIVIVGAHYDTVPSSPGANDNASGVAAALALARRSAEQRPSRTLRFVFFANEEPPFFQTDEMGSLVYAKTCKERNENIVAMLSLETIGYYSDKPNSQVYPWPFGLIYPSTGDFLGFVSDLSSRSLLHQAIASFRRHCKFPSEGGAIPQFVPGITWSDQWSFWQFRYPAIMLTDTAPFRYPHYHCASDTADKIDFDSLTRVVSGLQSVVAALTKR